MFVSKIINQLPDISETHVNKMGVCDEKYLKVYRLVCAGTGVSIGVSAFFVFGMKYHNWNVALWGLLSGNCHLISYFVVIEFLMIVCKKIQSMTVEKVEHEWKFDQTCYC